MNKKDELNVRIVYTEIRNSEFEKLVGIEVDAKLNVNEHLNIISKGSRKANALSRVTP